jgi:hypothetical protein
MPDLVNRTHATRTDQFENLKIREYRGDGFNRWGCQSPDPFGGTIGKRSGCSKDTLGAKPLRSLLGNGGTTLRTDRIFLRIDINRFLSVFSPKVTDPIKTFWENNRRISKNASTPTDPEKKNDTAASTFTMTAWAEQKEHCGV